MTLKYGYEIGEESSDDETDNVNYGNTKEKVKTNCDLCDFKGKTIGGLKTHVTTKHRDK